MMEINTINKIRELRKEGKKIREIAEELNISISKVKYYITEEHRKEVIRKNTESFRNKPKEERQKISSDRKEYMKAYQKKRYHEDKAFRDEKKNNSHEYYHNKVKALNL